MTHGIVEILRGNNSIQSIVGTATADSSTYKAFAVLVPQTEKPPFIACRVVNVEPTECKDQQSNEEVDTIQIDCYHYSYEECYELYRVVRSVLDNYSGTLSDGTQIDVQFQNARDMTAQELTEIAKRDFYGIISLYRAEVELGNIT